MRSDGKTCVSRLPSLIAHYSVLKTCRLEFLEIQLQHLRLQLHLPATKLLNLEGFFDVVYTERLQQRWFCKRSIAILTVVGIRLRQEEFAVTLIVSHQYRPVSVGLVVGFHQIKLE